MSIIQLLRPAEEMQVVEHTLSLHKVDLKLASNKAIQKNEQISDRISSFGVLDDPNACPTTILACALSLVHPAPIAEMLAKQLIATFVSIGAVLAASQERIRSTIPHSDITFRALRAMQILLSHSLREEFERKIDLSSGKSVRDYLRLSLAHKDVEVIRLLLMDSHSGLIRDELHAQGTGNHVSYYPREIVKKALEVGAYGLIIVHNRPSGHSMPSANDKATMERLEEVLKIFNIVLHDLITVGHYDCYSSKLMRLI